MTHFAKSITAATLAMALAFPAIAVAKTSASKTPNAPKAAMKYDCTKAGNKNKAACKSSATTTSTSATTTTSTTKTTATTAAPAAATALDCTKFINKFKAACKKPAIATPVTGASAPSTTPATTGAMAGKRQHKPVETNGNIVTTTNKNGAVVHYDCSKAGNKTKKACQGH